jgi:DNA adenine methylase
MAEKMSSATLFCASFQTTLSMARPGDVVYCDPPYVNPGRFTAYHASGFTPAMQIELTKLLQLLPERGFMSSHHATMRLIFVSFIKPSLFMV